MTQFCSVAALGNRALRRLFRDHVDSLPRVAPALRGRGSAHGPWGNAGGAASFTTGPLSANLLGAFYSAGGALAAALLAELFIRAQGRRG